MANNENDDEIYGGRSARAVGERLRLFREIHGLTQAEFARRVDLAPNTYNQLERGRNYPNIETLWKFADTFRLDMNWLLGGDPGGLRFDLADALYKAHTMRERDGESSRE